MAGLLSDSITAGEQGMRGMADASAMDTGQTLQNYLISAKNKAANFELAGQLIGTAIGSIWKEPAMGGKIGKQEGAKWGGILSGTGPQGSSAGGDDQSSGESMLFGSLLKHLGNKHTDTTKPSAATPTDSSSTGATGATGAAGAAGATGAAGAAGAASSSTVLGMPLPNLGTLAPGSGSGAAGFGFSNGDTGFGSLGAAAGGAAAAAPVAASAAGGG